MAEFYPKEISSVIGLVDTYLLWNNENNNHRGFEHYHPSAFGRCLRLMQYQRYAERGLVEPHPKPSEPFLIRTWGNGHSMHDRWRSYFEDIGVLRGYWVCMNPLCSATSDNGEINTSITAADLKDPGKWIKSRRVYGKDELQGCFKPEKCICGWKKFHYDEINVTSKELNFIGHADLILDFSRLNPDRFAGVRQMYKIEELPKNPIVIDMKSCNHYDFQDVAKGNPHDYYIIQLMIYANILQCDYGVLIYENKNNQRTAAFKVERKPELWEQICRQAKEMNEMVEVADEDGNTLNLLPPPRPKSKSDKECDYCAFQDICHNSSIWADPELASKRKEFYGDL